MCALISKLSAELPLHAQALRSYSPVVNTDQLIPGIDNIRFDASLSPKFAKFCPGFISQLLVKHSDAAQLLHNSPGAPKPADRKEFREQLQDILVTTLNRANAEKKPQLETLCQGAILKFLTQEVQAQFAAVVSQGREKVKLLQRPGQEYNPRGHQLQQTLAAFQASKRIVFRRVGRELLELIGEVRGDVVRKTRESFFGADASEQQAIFFNPLIFTEDGKNDYVNLESYVMFGNFQKDPDHFELVDAEVRSFLEWADSHSEASREYRARQEACADLTSQIEDLRRRQTEPAPKRGLFSRGSRAPEPVSLENLPERIAALESRLNGGMESFRGVAQSYSARLDEIISAPENATLLVDSFQTEPQLADARKPNGSAASAAAALQEKVDGQNQALSRLYRQFAAAGLIPYILAAYETAKIYHDFCPPLNPQQLKEALVDAGARKKVAHLIREYRLPHSAVETMEHAAAWVSNAGMREIQMVLVRFLRDYMRFQRDLRNFRAFQRLLEQIHFPLEERQRELSEMNHTLHEFLLSEEAKEPKRGKIASHVIMKADIRDSTSITAELFARELNPASYFSLNFFDPIHKLAPRYGASKVFLEGDAIILSVMETEGNPRDAYSVARTCCLAREIIEGVRAVNDRAAQKSLPVLELGIGICYQASAPMFLMDGERPIMISKALNESDRLSSCSKLAKQVLSQRNRFFNVFRMQLQSDKDNALGTEEFLLHYNVEGIEINELAFEKLCAELSMTKLVLNFPIFGDPETVELYCGTLPMGESFQKVVVRKGRIPQLNPQDYRVVEYTNRYYYEVCSSKPLHEYVSKQLGW